jgi:hypothetical protein
MSAAGSGFFYYLGRNLLKDGKERRRIADRDKANYASLETDREARALHERVQEGERDYQQWRVEAYQLYGRPWRKKTKAKIDAYVIAKFEDQRPARLEAAKLREEIVAFRKGIDAHWEDALKDVPRGDYSNEVLTEQEARVKAFFSEVAASKKNDPESWRREDQAIAGIIQAKKQSGETIG